MNRVALLDAADTATTGTLTTATAGLTSNGRRGAYFWPWLQVPGIVAGTIRTVPPSAGVAGKIAANDAINGPNSPAAGDRGVFRWVMGLTQAGVADATRENLNLANVDVLVNRYGLNQVYGWRSLADPVADAEWINFGNCRLLMDIANRLNLSAQAFVFEQIDGRGETISAFGGQLSGELLPYWSSRQLYGVTPEEAFFVDVGPGVNTPQTIANLELHAVANVRMSPFAELVAIEIVKTAITEAV
jgi:phage tail sheath protein FI